MEKPAAITVKYNEVKSFEFAQVMGKVSNTPTSLQNAAQIRNLVKAVNDAGEMISKAYGEEILEKYAKRDEKGEIIRPEGDPAGFTPDETKLDEFMQAQEEFGNREADIHYRPLTPAILADVKLTARELDLLGTLFTEENGPGLPPGLKIQK